MVVYSVSTSYPQRIVCLTEETTEILYLLGEEQRIVGISGFTVRPARARKEKLKVSAFTSARLDRIVELKPDLVLGFSDLQAEIAHELIRLGIAVHVFNQRSVAQILQTIRVVGGIVGCEAKAQALADKLAAHLEAIRDRTADWPHRPRVYFEEWEAPTIAALHWVSELIAIAGGDNCFADLAAHSLGKDRIIRDARLVIERAPEVIIGSWCGKKFRPELVAERPG